MAKQLCANCVESSDFEGEICDDCKKVLKGYRDKLRDLNFLCTHKYPDGSPLLWNYQTRIVEDEFHNEASIDEWTCPDCGEVMDSERTS